MQARPYDLLLGYSSWLATRVNKATALADGNADCDAGTSQEAALLALAKMDELIAANLDGDPAAANIIRTHIDAPPEATVREAKAHFEDLEDPQQTLIVALIEGVLLNGFSFSKCVRGSWSLGWKTSG